MVFIFSIKIIYLSLFPEKNFYLSNNKNHFINERADIIDRNGAILARNIDIYSAGIRPQLVQDKKKFLINLKLVFPELDIMSGVEIINNHSHKDVFLHTLEVVDNAAKLTKKICVVLNQSG